MTQQQPSDTERHQHRWVAAIERRPGPLLASYRFSWNINPSAVAPGMVFCADCRVTADEYDDDH